ncbi:MAG: cation-efflux pump [Actinobacteria bacterium]|nr:MAG: cation-efflux pump [Actinomycetota bacterium]
MSPQRRTALVSVLAACALIALKVAAGIPSHSLGLLSEAAHSGIDLVAALLTFFAVGVAGRPADPSHAYGHGKAEHLAALAEAAILVVAAVFISWRAVSHLTGLSPTSVHAEWYALLALAVVISVDFSRMLVSLRVGRRYGSAALQANAVHFASDLAGSVAVLGGLLGVRAGWKEADSAAALFVAVLVLAAAARLMRRNVDVLMDRVPSEAHAIASRAIGALEPPVQLRRLRMRQAGGRQFADVVIGVPPGAAVGQGHAAADAVEAAVHDALPESDVVVHVEPQEDETALRERTLAAAQRVPQVREIHNLSVLRTDAGAEVSLHLKLPADLSLEDAHAVASEVEQAIAESVPEVSSVQTHLEPLAEPARGTTVERDTGFVEAIVRAATGAVPRELRFLETDDGLVAFVTLGLDPATTLADAHRRASEVEELIRRERPEIAEVIVHTEP